MDEKHGHKASTGTYRVRGISRDLHRAARLRATSEGTTLRAIVLQALQAYSTGTWSPPGANAGSRTNGTR
jgi:predicted HicB family RNase H-like nuclease